MPNPDDFDDPVAEIKSALAIVRPDQIRTLLLGACVCNPEVAATAWQDFQQRVGDIKQFFETDMTGLKGLLPVIYGAARRNKFALEKELQSYLRVATVREDLRSTVIREIHANILTALTEANIPVIALRGGALADTAYETPVERHCHALHLLVRPDSLTDIGKALRHCDFAPARLPEAAPGARQGFRHKDGLPLVVNASLYDAPVYQDDAETLWSASLPAKSAGVPVRVLSPTHHLIYILTAAFHERTRGHLRWACDAMLLINGEPGTDWLEFSRMVKSARLDLPIDTMLRFLTEELDAPVPRAVLTALDTSPSWTNRRSLEAALSGAVGGVSTLREIWHHRMQSKRGHRTLLRFLFLPSTDFLLFRFGPRAKALVPFRYAYRPAAYVGQRLFWRVSGLPVFGRLTHRGKVAAAIAKTRT
jgi:putative nucleotidyltransferase-like protein